MDTKFLTDGKYLIRLIMVVFITTVTIFCIRNFTPENNFSRPEWEPDNSILQIIWPFIMILYTWCWYQSSSGPRWLDLLYGFNLCLIAGWAAAFYLQKWLATSTIVICFLVIISIIQTFNLFQHSLDNGLLSSVITGWLIIGLLITINTRIILPVLGQTKEGMPQHPHREVDPSVNPADLD